MLFHNAESQHPIALSFSDASVWCYSCNSCESILYNYLYNSGELNFADFIFSKFCENFCEFNFADSSMIEISRELIFADLSENHEFP